MKVALISPNQNMFSETFIQAHRNLNTQVLFFYDGLIPKMLEGKGYIGKTKSDILISWILKIIGGNYLSPEEIAFSRALKCNKISIVLAEYGTTGASILRVCQRNKIPLVTIFHGYDASVKSIIEKFKGKYIELFNYSKRILVVSRVMHNRLKELGCPYEKLVINPCAPADIFLEIQPSFKKRKSFISVGRFVNKKAHYYLVLAFKKVVDKYPDAKLLIAGEGQLYEVTFNLVKYFGLENNIIFLGVIDHLTFGNYLSEVLGYIQHSITAQDGDMEGTPVAILEASAAGLPVIATKHAGIPDVIIDGVTGFLINEHEVDQMSEKIIFLIENPECAIQFGENGKLYVKENFSMKKHLNIIYNALEQSIR